MHNISSADYVESLVQYDATDDVHVGLKTKRTDSFFLPRDKASQRSMAISWISKSIDRMEQSISEYEFAKRKILELFEKKRTLYFSDISKELDIDIQVIVSICKELAREGRIHAKGS